MGTHVRSSIYFCFKKGDICVMVVYRLKIKYLSDYLCWVKNPNFRQEYSKLKRNRGSYMSAHVLLNFKRVDEKR